jgi:type II secretory pathway pseudopilin PulG
MIVVVIMGLLAAMAIPRFMAANARTRQAEAREILKQVYVMQRAYRVEFDTYWGNGITANSLAGTAFSGINVEIMASAMYTYTMTAGPDAFTCTATCSVLDDDATQDVWTMDQNGDLILLSDDATT